MTLRVVGAIHGTQTEVTLRDELWSGVENILVSDTYRLSNTSRFPEILATSSAVK